MKKFIFILLLYVITFAEDDFSEFKYDGMRCVMVSDSNIVYAEIQPKPKKNREKWEHYYIECKGVFVEKNGDIIIFHQNGFTTVIDFKDIQEFFVYIKD